MLSTETNKVLFLSIGLKPTPLPIGIDGWMITHAQANLLIRKIGEPSKVEDVRLIGSKYSWIPAGPCVLLDPDYWGIAFESEQDAELTIHRIRQMGMSKETSHWFLTMNGDEARQVLVEISHTVYPNRKEGIVYELSEGKLGYLDCWTYNRAHWFPTREDYTKYETKHLRIEASL